MRKIRFVARWYPNKKQAWSGIMWGLHSSLSKYYKLEEIDISGVNSPFINRVFVRLSKMFKFKLDDVELSLVKRTKKLLYKKGPTKGTYFQFYEAISDNDTTDTYMFIDESIDHVLYMYNNKPDILAKSNYANANFNYLKERRNSQNEYFRNCAGVFTLCHWLAEDLVERTGIPAEKVHYGGSGINVDFEKIDESKKTGNKILFVGKDFERKGGYHVVEAFKLLRQKMPTSELYIAGPKTNPISEDIPGYNYLGLCNREELNALYNKCDVFAMPSYFEAFGIVFVEALTFGLPCLVRNCQDMPYVIEHGKTGLVIEKDDVATTSEYMFRLLTDSSYKTNVKNNRDFYRDYYSWDTVAKRIHDVIG